MPCLLAGGTEPKLKWYSEMSRPDPEEARAELAVRLGATTTAASPT